MCGDWWWVYFVLGMWAGTGAGFALLMAWCIFVDWRTRRAQRAAWRPGAGR